MKSFMAAACAALVLALAAYGAAQTNDSIDARIRGEAVESVAAIIERHYPWPDAAAAIAAHVWGRFPAWDCDYVATLDALARANPPRRPPTSEPPGPSPRRLRPRTRASTRSGLLASSASATAAKPCSCPAAS